MEFQERIRLLAAEITALTRAYEYHALVLQRTDSSEALDALWRAIADLHRIVSELNRAMRRNIDYDSPVELSKECPGLDEIASDEDTFV